MFLAKYRADGTLAWARALVGADPGSVAGIAVGSDASIVVAGSFRKRFAVDEFSVQSQGGLDVFVAKFTLDGNLLWLRQAGGKGRDIVADVVVSNRAIAVVGSFETTASFGQVDLASAGQEDGYLAILDPDGDVVTARRIGGDGQDMVLGAAVAGAEALYSVGFFERDGQFGYDVLTSAGMGDVFLERSRFPEN